MEKSCKNKKMQRNEKIMRKYTEKRDNHEKICTKWESRRVKTCRAENRQKKKKKENREKNIKK